AFVFRGGELFGELAYLFAMGRAMRRGGTGQFDGRLAAYFVELEFQPFDFRGGVLGRFAMFVKSLALAGAPIALLLKLYVELFDGATVFVGNAALIVDFGIEPRDGRFVLFLELF